MFFSKKTLLASIFVAAIFYAPKAYSRDPDPIEIPRNRVEEATVYNHCVYTPTLFGRRMFNERHGDDPTLALSASFSDLRNQNFNDRAGSICVPAGWKVEVFGYRSFERPLATFTGPSVGRIHDFVSGGTAVRSLARYWNFGEGSGAEMNDIISSVRVYRTSDIDVDNAYEICLSPCPPFIRFESGAFTIYDGGPQ